MNDVNYHKMSRLLAVTGRPEYVKVASEHVDCPVNGYADPIRKLYPCHTKEATFLSFLNGIDRGADSEQITAIRKYARFWNIEQDCADAEAKLADDRAELSTDDLPDHDFALVQQHGTQLVRKYAAFDPSTTVDAAIAFYENRTLYPLAWRKQASVSLLERAERFDAHLPAYVSEYLHKAAGYAVATPGAIDDAIVARMNLTPAGDRESLSKMASVLNAIAEDENLRYNTDLVSEVLDTMDSYDREIKLAQHYSTGRCPLPEEMLTLTETDLKKYAGCNRRIVSLVNGHEVDVADLSPAALDAVDEKLASMSLAKLAEVLPTLPKPEADLLIALLPQGQSWKTAAEAIGTPAATPAPSPIPAPAPSLGTPAAATPAPIQAAPVQAPAIAPASQPAAVPAGNNMQPDESADAYFDRISAKPATPAPMSNTLNDFTDMEADRQAFVNAPPVPMQPLKKALPPGTIAVPPGPKLVDTPAERLKQARDPHNSLIRGGK